MHGDIVFNDEPIFLLDKLLMIIYSHFVHRHHTGPLLSFCKKDHRKNCCLILVGFAQGEL